MPPSARTDSSWRPTSRRSNRTIAAVRDAVGRIPQLRRVVLVKDQYSSRFDAYKAGQNPTAFDPAFGGSSITDLGFYGVSLAVHLFGEPLSITATGMLLDSGSDGQGLIVLGYDGFEVDCLHSKIGTAGIQSQIGGERAAIVFDDCMARLQVHLLERDAPNQHPSALPGPTEDLTRERVGGHLDFVIGEFVRLLRSDARQSDVHPLQNTLAAHLLLDEARRIGRSAIPNRRLITRVIHRRHPQRSSVAMGANPRIRSPPATSTPLHHEGKHGSPANAGDADRSGWPTATRTGPQTTRRVARQTPIKIGSSEQMTPTGSAIPRSEHRAPRSSVPLTLHLVRHGRTRFNDECRVQGWCDLPLTVGGRAGVQLTTHYLREVPFVAAWTSPAGRTRLTGEMILAAHSGVILTAHEGLREFGFGDFEALPELELYRRIAPHELYRDILAGTFPGLAGGESGRDFLGRVATTFREIERANPAGGDVWWSVTASPSRLPLHGVRRSATPTTERQRQHSAH